MKVLKNNIFNKNYDSLKPFLSEKAFLYVSDLINYLSPNEIIISNPRKTKFGDFKVRKNQSIITINNDLDKNHFLITLIHELAHLSIWNEYKNRVLPHGTEWKNTFKRFLQPLIAMQVFPNKIEIALNNSLNNLKASTCSDFELLKAIKHQGKDNTIQLKDIAINSIFHVKNHKEKYIKMKNRRTRALCKNLNNQKLYTISLLCEVELFD